MKKMLFVLSLCLLSSGLGYWHYYRSALSGFHCNGLMVYRADTAHGKFTYTAEAKMYFTNKHEGFYALNGTFTHEGQTYNLNRTKFFTYRKVNNKDLYEITLTREIVSPLDNTPRALADIVLLSVGESVLPRFRLIDKRTIIVSLLYSPFFICAKE